MLFRSYLNSPETDLYQKGSVLFGLQQARQAIRMTRSIIVCEGFFDVVTPSQAQIEHIVSTCGTALTETQAEMVLSLADRVFFCFDGDAAGAKATWRAAEMLVPLASDQHEIRLCRLPADEDPDSFVRKFGAPKFQEALDASPTLTAYLIGEITRGAKLPEARARSLSVAASLWRQFSAPGLGIFFRQFACEALQLTPADRAEAPRVAHIVESVLGEPAALSPEAARITASLHRPSLVPDVLIALRENGIEIEEISVQKPSLDEVFFTLTGRPEADETTGPDEPES